MISLFVSRTCPWMPQCSAAACGVPLGTTWTRSWSTVCYLSSISETGSLSVMLGPTVWVSHSAPPPTHPHPLYTMSYPQETGKDSRYIFTFGAHCKVHILDSNHVSRAKAQLTQFCFPPPGLRCRTPVSPMRLRWRTSHWSLISSTPAKQRLHSQSQLSNQQPKGFYSPL